MISLRDRFKAHRGPLALLLVVWAVYAGPLLSPRTNLYLTDTFSQDVPLRIYAAREIRSGTFPHWTPLVHCGYPLFANGETGILYPFFLIYVISPTPQAHDVFMAVHYLMAGLFMYVFLTGHVRSGWAAAVGSVTFMTGSFMQTTHVIPGTQAAACWLPLSLYLLDRHARGDRTAIWWCAIVNATSLMAGNVHISLISYSLQAVYLLWLRADRFPWGYLRAASVAFVLALALSAIQMIPTADFLSASNRSGSQFSSPLDWGTFSFDSIRWKHLVTFVLPDYLGTPWTWSAPDPPWDDTFWEDGLIVFHGFAAVLLLPWAILAAKPRRTVWFWTAVLVSGLLLASPSPLRWLLMYVPLHNLFRLPIRYVLVTSIAISLLMAMGYADLAQRITARWAARRPRLARAIVVSLAIIVSALAFRYTMGAYTTAADFYTIHDERIVDAARSSDHFRLLPATRALYGYWKADEARLRANARSLPASYNLLFGVPVATLFDQGNAVSPLEMAELVQSRHPRFLDLAAVTHLSAPVPLERLDRDEIDFIQPVPIPPESDLETIATEPSALYRYRAARPRAWMVYRTRQADDPDESLAAVIADDFDPSSEAVTWPPCGPYDTPETPPRVNVRDQRSNVLVVDVETDTDGLLVVADAFWDDITVELDGQPTELLRANHAFRGVEIPAGRHRVVMKYYPDSFYLGRLISAIAGVITLGGLWRAYRSPAAATSLPKGSIRS